LEYTGFALRPFRTIPGTVTRLLDGTPLRPLEIAPVTVLELLLEDARWRELLKT